MLLNQFNTDELQANFYSDWRGLVEQRARAEGPERDRLDKIYNKVLPYILEIERARNNDDLSLLGLIATAGSLLTEKKGVKMPKKDYRKIYPITLTIKSFISWTSSHASLTTTASGGTRITKGELAFLSD